MIGTIFLYNENKVMNNKELIASCRKALESEDEPHVCEWVDMVSALCDALEKAQELIYWHKANLEEHKELHG